ncbi:hypothetical protein CCC_01787 [Paramagnetospirillum magnetotacticum MS-1]|uniref:Uncharacterized protein n=1 Tax=Paramagnetospirillum magnetotacticum MS-1 TaxID=272627 RepID=A0A0C2YB67_PARME|nr:hypothetical protein [Paramagnetospirillum magnetotacticum]KIL96994.1 hypothetical protein CCC_01787 [Paramagnetospirillum magnetotacticum MS-1]
MLYRWEEIDQLAEILEAEVAGHPVDTDRARELAERLVRLCPDIAKTMSRVIERFAPEASATAA